MKIGNKENGKSIQIIEKTTGNINDLFQFQIILIKVEFSQLLPFQFILTFFQNYLPSNAFSRIHICF